MGKYVVLCTMYIVHRHLKSLRFNPMSFRLLVEHIELIKIFNFCFFLETVNTSVLDEDVFITTKNSFALLYIKYIDEKNYSKLELF